jgi:hypothetical protein
MSDKANNRVFAKIDKQDGDGCWMWTGGMCANGYGGAYYKGRQTCAHRIVYEILVGPIPKGLQLDHLCKVRRCVNPLHLEPVTPQENTLRSSAPDAQRRRHSAQTHCKNGHIYSADNTYTRIRKGYIIRQCKQCTFDRKKKVAA